MSPVEALAEFVLVLSPPVAPTGPGGPPARIGGEDDGESVYWLLSPSLILSTTRIKSANPVSDREETLLTVVVTCEKLRDTTAEAVPLIDNRVAGGNQRRWHIFPDSLRAVGGLFIWNRAQCASYSH